MGVGVAGIEGDGAAVRVDRAVEPAVRLQHDAEIAVPVRLVGRERDAPRDERQRLVVASLLMREHAGVVECARMVGRNREHAAVQLAGLGEPLVLLQQDRERDRLFERQLTRRRL